MLKALVTLDSGLARTRPAWLWLGQLALAGMGIHLAADHLDDLLYQGIVALQIPWASADQPLVISAWAAVVLELTLWWRAFGALTRSTGEAAPDLRTWVQRSTVRSWVLPLFWIPVAAAGAWSVGMAVEDLIAPHLPQVARPAAWLMIGFIGWRLGITGAWQVCRAAPTKARRLEGVLFAPIEVVGGALALFYALPVWGWM